MGGINEHGARLFSVVANGRINDTGHIMKYGKFLLNRRNLFTVSVTEK